MKILSTLIFLFVGLLNHAQTWQKIQDFPGTARDDGSSFTINNKAYCGNGLEVGWTCPNDFYSFDLATETWTTVTSFPNNQQRQYASSFVVNGKGYIFGGYNCSNNYLNDLWEYNPVTNIWAQKSDMPSAGRSGAVSFVINDTAYIVGGRTSVLNAISETWGYDAINDSWFQKNDIPNNGVWRGVSFSYNNQGFVGLGKDSLGIFNKEFYAYSSDKNGWSIITGYTHVGRTYTGYTQADSLGYLFGGLDSLNVVDTTFEILNLKNFISQTSIPFSDVPRRGCMLFCNNYVVYVTTGVSSANRFNETWKIDTSIGIKEYQKNNSVSVYPNPNDGYFSISSKGKIIHSVKILSVSGNILEEKIINNRTAQFNKDDLSKGVYILQINFTNQTPIYQKLIIE